MAEKKTIKIFIASAGEMEAERLQVDHVFTRLNKTHKHLTLDPVKYEYDTIAGSQPGKKRIQDNITPKLTESHCAVFIFYSKIGKYTKEEFDHAMKENKKLFVFFKKGFSPDLAEMKAYKELLAFNKSLNDTVLKKEYKEVAGFDQQLYETLNLFLAEEYPAADVTEITETATTLSKNNQELIQMLGEKDRKIQELEKQLNTSQDSKIEDELQKLLAEQEAIKNELRQSEEIIKQQAKDKEILEQQLTLQKDKDELKAKALEEVEKGNYTTAEEYLKQSAKSSIDETAETFYELAKIKKLQFLYADALKYYELAATVNPENSLYLIEAGMIANNMWLYNKAIELHEKALNILERKQNNESPEIASIYNHLGLAYNKKGDYDKAIESFNKSLAIDKKIYKKNHPNIATLYNNLGAIYEIKGEYDKAIEFYEKALKISKKIHGEEHFQIAILYSNLGLAYDCKGEYDKAIGFLEKALTIEKKFYGGEDPTIAISYNNLGSVNDNKREYDKAIRFYKKALTIDKKFFGDEHPNIAVRYNNLGLVCYNKGEYDKAIEFLEKALIIDRKFHAEEHPDIATRYNNLGLAYEYKGEYEKAVSYCEKALQILNKFLPESHPNIRIVTENLAAAQAALEEQQKKKPRK